ncbi:hypothetical protein BDZ97DRAFT_2074998 [Flammula alnicola]|nr:hypothetical protein BDZ97DRAFT_2074998 [Flammula alnicola]
MIEAEGFAEVVATEVRAAKVAVVEEDIGAVVETDKICQDPVSSKASWISAYKSLLMHIQLEKIITRRVGVEAAVEEDCSLARILERLLPIGGEGAVAAIRPVDVDMNHLTAVDEAKTLLRRPGGTTMALAHLQEVVAEEEPKQGPERCQALFQDEEELIKPGVEDVDDTEQSHLSTADQVSRVFSSGNIPRMESDLEDEEDGEEIEEVDFNEVDKLFDSSATTKTTTTVLRSKLGEITTITFTGFYVDPIPTCNAQQLVTDPTASIPDDVDDLAKMMDETLSAADEPDNSEDVAMSVPSTEQSAIFATQEPSAVPQPSEAAVVDKPEEQLFCVDHEPAPVPTEMAPTQDLLPSALRDDDEDDIIVYVAPHPRKASSHNGEDAPVKSKESAPSNGPDSSRFSPYVSAAALPIASGSSSQHPLSSIPPIPDPPSFSSLSFSFSQSTTTKAPVTPGKSTA